MYISTLSAQKPFNISFQVMTPCCTATQEKHSVNISCDIADVIWKGHNESDNQYGPVREVDRLRNSGLVTSDPEPKKKKTEVE